LTSTPNGYGGEMNPVFTFVLGLLIGWLIEWLIDYFYWRRRYAENETPLVARTARSERASAAGEVGIQSVAKVASDDLKVIKGIGTVIERKLNDAGIYTFEQLGNLSAAGLRRILGNTIERLADEEALLRQARDLARRK
jgi:predicted flap endonuclease-1-like 5' DNA nuclease